MRLLSWLTGNDAKASPSKYVNKHAKEVVEHLRIGGEARLVAARDYEIPLYGGRWPLIVSTKTVLDRQGKEVVTLGANAALETALVLERKAFQLLFATEDRDEGIAAFIEKRPGQFKGR